MKAVISGDYVWARRPKKLNRKVKVHVSPFLIKKWENMSLVRRITLIKRDLVNQKHDQLRTGNTVSTYTGTNQPIYYFY